MIHQPRLTITRAVAGLREIAQALSTAIDLDTTLDLIVRKTTEVMHVDSCSLYLLDADDDILLLRATTGLRPQVVDKAMLKLGEGMTGVAVAQNKPVYAAIAQKHPDFKWLDHQKEPEFQSLLAVPLTIHEEPLGAINVQTSRRHHYGDDEIKMLQLISDLAAGALAKARLYRRQKASLDELQALAQVSRVVTSPQYLDEMLNIVTDMAAKTMNAAVCSLFLVDEKGKMLELRSAKRLTSPYRYREPLAVGQGVLGWVVQSGEPMYVANISTEPRYLNPALAEEEGLVSLLAVPLTVREHVIGVIICYTNTEHLFTEEEHVLFSTLANQTALAIENARLVTNAAIVREMHHRIKNNLQTVAMLMQLQISDADRLDTREVLETNIHRIRSIATVHEVLSERGFHMVDVKDVLERIAKATVDAVNAPYRTVKIDVTGGTISLPSQMATALALVVNELVQNAVEHAFAGRKSGSIQVSLGRSAEFITVWVRDNGVGLPAEMAHGLGLEIAHTLVLEDLNGEIIFGRLSEGTEIIIKMPRSIEHDLDD